MSNRFGSFLHRNTTVTPPTTKIVAQYQTNPIQSVAPKIPAIDPLKMESDVNVFVLICALCAIDSPLTNKYFSSFSSKFRRCLCALLLLSLRDV